MMVAADTTPTEALDLGRDGLNSALMEWKKIVKSLDYLKLLTETCEEYGYPLPYSADEAKALYSEAYAITRRVVVAQDERGGGENGRDCNWST